MKKLFLLLLMVVATIGVAVAQNRTISGTVTYEGDGEPLAGVTIMPIGGGHGVATDIDGHFSLKVPASVKMIRVSYVGMHTQELPVGQNMKIVMTSADQRLDDVIVVAYGTSKKSAFTGSAAAINADQIEDAMVTNAVNALKGTVAGVQITQANGQPGTSPTVRIRGVGSINASAAPLYVVDGMPYEGSISEINSQDIESMTVLKDAAAAALYGARGANGVILVTTKKGRDGSAKVTVDARWGSNSRQIPNYAVIADPRQYYELTYAALYNSYVGNYGEAQAHTMANAQLQNAPQSVYGAGYKIFTVPEGQSLIGTNGKMNPNATLGWSDGKNYYMPDNWADATFRHGLRQEYNLSIQGGNDRFNYYVSGGYLGDEGIIIGSSYDRISARTVMDYQAKSWLKIGTNMAYNHVKNSSPGDQTNSASGQNAFMMANRVAPVYPMFVRNANGEIMMDESTGNPIYDYGDGKYSGAIRSFMGRSNAVSDLIYSSTEYFYDVFNGKWYATVTPIKNFNITGTVGYYLNNSRVHALTSKLYGQMAMYGGNVEQQMGRDSSVNLQLLGTYNFTLGDKHNFDLLAGYESYEYNFESLYGKGQNLYSPWNWTLNNSLYDENRKASGSAGQYSTRGILARVNYDYDGKYYLSGSYRRDASSRFAPENRWGNFFSVSAAWDLAKEGFLQNSTWVDLLKVKASFGQQGNDGILDASGYQQYYAYLDQYSISGVTEWSDGNLTYKGNRDITWEKSDTWNAGVDFGFKQGLISGSIEYFRRTVNDMLYNKPVPPSNGYSYYPMNIGSMRNQGVEIDLNIRPIANRNFTWDLNANLTYLNSKVLSLSPDLYKNEFETEALIDGSRIFKANGPFFQLYIPQYAGVDKETGDPLWYASRDKVDKDGNKIIIGYQKAGYNQKADSEGYRINSNGERYPIYEKEEYTTNQYREAQQTNRKETGSMMPKVYGGFGTTLRYKGFDFTCQFSYQLGGKLYDSAYTGGLNSGAQDFLGRNWNADIVNAWTPENPNTNIPRLNYSAQYGLDSMSDFGLISSNYLSLNNITFGYTLPESLLRDINIESVRIYLAGENLAVWSKRKGLDPRSTLAGGLDGNTRYSAIRNISGGIRVEF